MPRKTAAGAAETRHTIVREARRLFSERGFADTATAEIAAAAQVTEGALFHHFKNKRALFEEVVNTLAREFHDEVQAVGHREQDARPAFLAATRAALIFSQGEEYRRIVLVDAPSVLGSAVAREIDSRFGLDLILPVLRALAPKGSAEPQVRALALLVLGYLNEAAFALARGDGDVDVDTVMAVLERTLDRLILT
ncbi:TetR family transcriptional regulator [Sphingomonas sp. LHG3406-1]|uniref:TetR family transcriptional regulator n=1 Tax=Sphingomonas sp. LHG3406-1 TaxID=2804617 RepID=UPI00261B6A65|nr:TetR family transcriptional regulator [Sphingomonas sp. LHG3406-1]